MCPWQTQLPLWSVILPHLRLQGCNFAPGLRNVDDEVCVAPCTQPLSHSSINHDEGGASASAARLEDGIPIMFRSKAVSKVEAWCGGLRFCMCMSSMLLFGSVWGILLALMVSSGGLTCHRAQVVCNVHQNCIEGKVFTLFVWRQHLVPWGK